jgi:hexosaminidase
MLGEDESYALEISSAQATLRAPTVLGALHGLETLLQLLRSDAGGWYLPEAKIDDRPRFPWRGLMIDVVRHWQPLDVIKRNLDGMALVKLNVLHLHLTDDQGFRVESKTCPRLHELGSDGHYFTHEQIREIIASAAERGIRVVPEFDIPGHATSWLVGHPELASAPGPYGIERGRGIFDPVLDPTNPEVYEILEKFLGEMAALFPDAYLHIGGDENNGVHWSAHPGIQAFIREHGLQDNAGLHAHFNGRIHTILAQHGKQLVGWDEILHPSLPAGSVVHSWRGAAGVAEATQQGFACIRSNGYYINLSVPIADHYLTDPMPNDIPLAAAQQKLVLGGEATMWSEWVTPEIIDSRIWPRTAAIAERFWSPREVRDVADMYRRLQTVSRRLEEAGLRHESYVNPALRRFAGDTATPADLAALRMVTDLLEPVTLDPRNETQKHIDLLAPLTGLVDCARSDNPAARTFADLVDAVATGESASKPYRCSPNKVEPDLRAGFPDERQSARPEVGLHLSGPPIQSGNPFNCMVAAQADLAALTQQLTGWKSAATTLATGLCARSARLHEALPLIQSLVAACEVGIEAAQMLGAKRIVTPGWRETQLAKLAAAAVPHVAAELAVIAALRRLVAAAAGGSAPAQPGSCS